ncbi:hypothetical protein [Segatella copri]|uniref:Right-handed parallel beta-helix repeat-containing protein n=1 Tax=Segatella copri TaxID=165179 RepID=A0A6G1VS67_9BACT|nr:hypothetical protein [Segatella copri]MQN58989.1 hypothetical protein [Segatella copri]MQP15872.1 hypothetical protein [Segatella copri]
MKRFTLFIITLTLTILQSAAQDTSIKGTITLSHQGNETNFAYNEMTKVMDAAADGDTVYFSTGYFQGDFIMTKKLAFIGSGADRDKEGNNCTYYEGKIVINLPEETKLTARLFDGICFYNSNTSITFKSSIDNVIFRKCYWDNNILSIDKSISYLLIDRCYCNLNFWGENIKKIIVRNSIVHGTPDSSNMSANVFFYNCNIRPNGGYGISGINNKHSARFFGTFYNCILNSNSYYMTDPGDSSAITVLINCLYSEEEDYVDDGCTIQNCYIYTDNNKKNIFDLTKEELLSNNYLGNDGTVVGCYGGKNPYTLSLSNKEVTNKVHLDRDKKQIQFNIKVSNQ